MSRGKVGDEMSTYSSYTRQACNFVFPTLGTKITGEDRPRPGKFRIKDEEADLLDEGKDTDEWALSKNFISIVPVQYDFTDYPMIEKLNTWDFE